MGRWWQLTEVAQGGAEHDDALELAEYGSALRGCHDFGDKGVKDKPVFCQSLRTGIGGLSKNSHVASRAAEEAD